MVGGEGRRGGGGLRRRGERRREFWSSVEFCDEDIDQISPSPVSGTRGHSGGVEWLLPARQTLCECLDRSWNERAVRNWRGSLAGWSILGVIVRSTTSHQLFALSQTKSKLMIIIWDRFLCVLAVQTGPETEPEKKNTAPPHLSPKKSMTPPP